MRYQVENSNKDFVSLQDEIAFIESYIAIERERQGYRCDIKFTVDIAQPEKYKIAPMIVFTFVENAFKHGTGTIQGSFIHIHLGLKDAVLELKVNNSVSEQASHVVSTKTGLENTKARLQMIYPERYGLQLQRSDNQFDALLQIHLA